jgi:hypothetical protein
VRLIRRYRHPGLAYPVVELVAEARALAVDRHLAHLGFAAPEHLGGMDAGEPDRLGFLDWVLLNDPVRAGPAIAIAGELDELAAGTEAARSEIAAIAVRLDRSVPHLLPPFYEEAARIFLARGDSDHRTRYYTPITNSAMAELMFGLARRAEQTHALSVDRDRLHRSFLEFSAAGAVRATALSDHATSGNCDYEQFREICLQWVEHRPPHPRIARDLRRLARRAGLDRQEADAAMLREFVRAPAISAADERFWLSYQDTLAALTARDPAFTARLVEFVPHDSHGRWLEILARCGVLAAMAEPAAWLSRFVASVAATQMPYQYAPLRKLVRTMAGRLRAEGVPVDLFHNGTNDPHLVDLCLAEGIPVGPVPASLSLENALNTKVPHRDLIALAHDERFRPALVDAIGRQLPRQVKPAAVRRLTAFPGLRMAVRLWLEATAEDVADAGLDHLKFLVFELEGVRASDEVFKLAPAAARRIAGTDVAARLASTLRDGVFDEVGWPAMEEAFRRIFEEKPPEPGDQRVVSIIGEAWPALCVRYKDRILVVGPDRILADHFLRIPQKLRPPHSFHVRASYVDGRLLVVWPSPSGRLAYWSDRPGEMFTPSGHTSAEFDDPPPPASIELPDGSRFTGGIALRPGDTAVPPRVPVHSDGTALWRFAGGSWVSVDESTGATSEGQVPPFFAEADLEHSWLRLAVPGTDNSVLGTAAGLHGWRVRKDGVIGEGLDGVRVRLDEDDHVPMAALRLPGQPHPLTVSTCHPAWLELWDANGARNARLQFDVYRQWQARGTALVPPLQWWHCLRVRDHAGSLALRRVSGQTARQLLDAAHDKEKLTAAIHRLLPEITHPELLAGVRGVVDFAAAIRDGLVPFQHSAAEVAGHSAPEVARAQVKKDKSLAEALNLQGAPRPRMSTADTELSLLDLLRGLRDLVGQVETGEALRTAHFKSIDHVPGLASLGCPGMLAWQAASPVTRRRHREALVEVLTAMAATGLTEPGGRWRLATLIRPGSRGSDTSRQYVFPGPHGFTVRIGSSVDKEGNYGYQVIQYTTVPGVFPDLPGHPVTRSIPLVNSLDVTGFIQALAEHGPLPWRPEAVTELSARTGMNRGNAALLLGGLPGVAAVKNTLKIQDRVAMGLTGYQAAEAKAVFAGLAEEDRFALLQAMIPADPATLWSDGPDVAAVARVWVDRLGHSAPVGEQLPDTVGRLPMEPATIADPGRWEEYLAKLDVWKLRDAIDLLWLLAYRLPAGSPMRTRLPAALSSVRAAVQDTRLSLNDFVDSADLTTLLHLAEDESATEIDVDGWLTLSRHPRSAGNHTVKFRPGLYRTQNRDIFAAVLDRLCLPGRLVTTMDSLHSGDLTDACAQHADARPGSYLQNPLVTVPDLVEQVANKYTVDSEVAVLYLQLLALPDPTDTNTARWSGWPPARMRAARLALAGTGLVVSASRLKSGRSLFLPGGWAGRTRQRRAMETWKLSMFEHSPVPHRTVAESFRLAWRRIEDGDIPAYQELHT